MMKNLFTIQATRLMTATKQQNSNENFLRALLSKTFEWLWPEGYTALAKLLVYGTLHFASSLF